MKLTELLKRITPVPWLLVTATDGDKWIGTGEGDDRITTLDGNTQPLDHAYLNRLSIHRPRPSMLTSTPTDSTASRYASLVNWHP